MSSGSVFRSARSAHGTDPALPVIPTSLPEMDVVGKWRDGVPGAVAVFEGESGPDLAAAAERFGVDIPVLRKDFVVHPAMLREAADWGASAALLMVSVLGEAVGEYLRLSHHLGLDALVEVHDEAELEVALAAGPEIIGVNNRDLRDFSVDLGRTERLAALAPADIAMVAESGLASRADLDRLAGAGVCRFLIGETLMRADDIAAATRALTA